MVIASMGFVDCVGENQWWLLNSDDTSRILVGRGDNVNGTWPPTGQRREFGTPGARCGLPMGQMLDARYEVLGVQSDLSECVLVFGMRSNDSTSFPAVWRV